MKKLILAAMMLIGLAGAAAAQTTVHHTVKHRATSPSKKKIAKTTKATDSLDERKNYEWKNGQKATPTGNEARVINESGFSAVRKDSSLKKKARPHRQGK